MCRWIESVVPAGYVSLAAAVLVGRYVRHRRARLAPRHYSQLPLDAAPEIENPVTHAYPLVVAKYVLSWMMSLVHLWALLDRMEDVDGNGWRLLKPAAWLVGWVTESAMAWHGG